MRRSSAGSFTSRNEAGAAATVRYRGQGALDQPGRKTRQFGNTIDFVVDSRVIFDLGGNKYRLIVHVS